jgi:hypothetical protein
MENTGGCNKLRAAVVVSDKYGRHDVLCKAWTDTELEIIHSAE